MPQCLHPPTPPLPPRTMAPKYQFYAVRSGKTPSSRGIYISWPDCQRETKGVTKAKHGHKAVFKGFQSKVEAEKYLNFQDDDDAALWVHNSSQTSEPNTPEGERRQGILDRQRKYGGQSNHLQSSSQAPAPNRESSSQGPAPNRDPHQRKLRPRGSRPNYNANGSRQTAGSPPPLINEAPPHQHPADPQLSQV